jgi:hypothetical protein
MAHDAMGGRGRSTLVLTLKYRSPLLCRRTQRRSPFHHSTTGAQPACNHGLGGRLELHILGSRIACPTSVLTGAVALPSSHPAGALYVHVRAREFRW